MATYNASNQPSGNDVAGSVFFKKFLASAESYIQQPTRLKKLLVDAFNKAREKKEIGAIAHEVWDGIQSLFRLIKLSVSGEYTGVPTTTVVAAVAVLIYFLSPIDLIPDFVPVIGLLDDVALFAWFTTSIKHELDKFHDWEQAKAATLVSDEELWRPSDPISSTNRSAKNAGTYNLPQATHTPARPQAAAADADAKSGASNSASASATQLTDAESDGAANQSAKSAGTYDLPEAPAATGQSATDAGLGSPSSSTSTPVHAQGADIKPGDENRTSDVAANTTDGSRDGNDGRVDTGGNNR